MQVACIWGDAKSIKVVWFEWLGFPWATMREREGRFSTVEGWKRRGQNGARGERLLCLRGYHFWSEVYFLLADLGSELWPLSHHQALGNTAAVTLYNSVYRRIIECASSLTHCWSVFSSWIPWVESRSALHLLPIPSMSHTHCPQLTLHYETTVVLLQPTCPYATNQQTLLYWTQSLH